MVEAAEELDRAIDADPAAIAGAVEPASLCGGEGVRHEAFRRQVRPTEVAARDSGAAEEDLADHTLGDRMPGTVEQVGAGVGNRSPDRHRRIDRLRVEVGRDRPDRRFGRAVLVDQLAAGARLEVAASERRAAGFPGHGDQLE